MFVESGRSNLPGVHGIINAGRPFCETSKGGRHFKKTFGQQCTHPGRRSGRGKLMRTVKPHKRLNSCIDPFKKQTMPDFTMCQNNECPQADNCWRFGCPPSKFQSYQIFQPEQDDEENFSCSFFKPYPTGGEVYQTNFPEKVQRKRLK